MSNIKSTKIRKTYVSYELASKAVIAAGITSQGHYYKWYKSSSISLPSDPRNAYKEVWLQNGGWYGFRTGIIKEPIVSYEEARAAAIAAGITSQYQYKEWCITIDISLPIEPNFSYKTEWVSWPVFLGKEIKEPIVSYEEAKQLCIDTGLQNRRQYQEWYKSSGVSLPSMPDRVYKDCWISWAVFLGKEIKEPFISYSEASSAAVSAGIKSQDQYHDWYKFAGISLPSNPPIEYKDEWVSWPLFLQTTYMNKATLLHHLNSLKSVLHTLTELELRMLLIQQGVYNSFERHHLGKFSLKEAVELLLINEQPIGPADLDIEAITSQDKIANHVMTTAEIAEENSKREILLPSLSDSAKTFDWFDENQSIYSCDEETIEFFFNNKIQSSWNDILNRSQEHVETEITNLRNKTGGDYFTTFKERFLAQYEGATNIQLPEGYGFNKGNGIIQPLLMQKLIAYMVKTKKRVGNWSGTGAGKTLGAILASRVTNSKLTVIVTINNTIIDKDSGWEKEINTAFPNYCNVMAKTKNVKLDPIKPNYLLLNYEAFSNGDALVNHLLELPIDMIVLDEIHFAKTRDKTESKRRLQLTRFVTTASNKNPDCKVLGMSATPVINSLQEAISLLTLITGNKYEELGGNPTINNALSIHKHLVLNGIRWIPKYEMVLNQVIKEVLPSNEQLMLLESLDETTSIVELESTLVDLKIQTILDNITTGTIVYTHYTNEGNIANKLKTAIKNKGFTCAVYTGNEPPNVKKENLEKFKNRQLDVLIGSSTIGTGVDGLQLVSNRMIIATLPWTNASYEQLTGRIFRQGSNFDKIDVIIPQIKRSFDNWSWDRNRMDRIEYKKTLADTAVDGVIPKGNLMSEKQLLVEALEALNKWTARIEENNIHEIHREPLDIPTVEDSFSIRQYGDFSHMNKQFAVSYSHTTHERLQANPDEFYKYHELYREARTQWNEIPYQVIANKLKDKPYLVIADFGCGEALLAKSLDNYVYSFDHVAIDDTVIECDMKQTPLTDNSIDVAVFSLSLQGLNWKDYLVEAKRSLKPYGNLFIAEPTYSWHEADYQELTNAITTVGFIIIQKTISLCGKFVYIDAVNLN